MTADAHMKALRDFQTSGRTGPDDQRDRIEEVYAAKQFAQRRVETLAREVAGLPITQHPDGESLRTMSETLIRIIDDSSNALSLLGCIQEVDVVAKLRARLAADKEAAAL